jgi:C1A family cysteine protease
MNMRRRAIILIGTFSIVVLSAWLSVPWDSARAHQEVGVAKAADAPTAALLATLQASPPPQAVLEANQKNGVRAERVTPFVHQVLARYLRNPEFAKAANVDLAAAPPQALIDKLTAADVEAAVRKAVDELTGTVPPANIRLEAVKQNAVAKQALSINRVRGLAAETTTNMLTGAVLSPALAEFDWREKGWVVRQSGIVTRSRNQGDPQNCGCCWAFATAGTFEAAYAKANLRLVNVSEQNLLDCFAVKIGHQGGIAFDCSGGWFAFDLLVNPGLPHLKDYPYTGQQGSCNDSIPTPYKALTWGYVTDQNQIPPISEIKTALCRYGPLAVAMFAGSYAFGTHDGITPIKEFPNGQQGTDMNGNVASVDHAIMIVGWNDSKHAWAIKNSWGEGWGVEGFGYVDYDSNNIGWGAAYVVPAGPPGGGGLTAKPGSPSVPLLSAGETPPKKRGSSPKSSNSGSTPAETGATKGAASK